MDSRTFKSSHCDVEFKIGHKLPGAYRVSPTARLCFTEMVFAGSLALRAGLEAVKVLQIEDHGFLSVLAFLQDVFRPNTVVSAGAPRIPGVIA